LKSITRRGYATASEAAKARRELIGKLDAGLVKPGATALTVNELLDLYLDGLDADQRLSPKTRHDYRVYAQTYVRKPLDNRKVRDVTPEVILTWQRRLLAEGGAKDGRPLAPNTIRLARAPLAGAFKLAASSGIVAVNPLMHAPRPKARRSVPRYWSPEQAREFLSLMEGDRTYPVWAFLMCAGLRIGELVALRWSNVDLTEGVVSVVEFSTYLGHDVVPSPGKSRDAIRAWTSTQLSPACCEPSAPNRPRSGWRQTRTKRAATSSPAGRGPYHPQYLSRLLGRYSEELGLPRLTAHGLRHTCATLMLANGVPPKVAAERLGHSDPSLFMNLYSHVTPSMQREAAEKIGAVLFG
jgi:integrase